MATRTPLHRAIRPIRKGASVLALAAVTALSACVSTRADDPFDAAVSSPHTWLRVENAHVQDMRISVIRHGARIPLGRVESMTVRTFRIEPAVLGPGTIRLQAEPIPAGTAYRSIEVILERGRGANFRVAPDLKLSTVVPR